jgi:hypothetical protein
MDYEMWGRNRGNEELGCTLTLIGDVGIEIL